MFIKAVVRITQEQIKKVGADNARAYAYNKLKKEIIKQFDEKFMLESSERAIPESCEMEFYTTVFVGNTWEV